MNPSRLQQQRDDQDALDAMVVHMQHAHANGLSQKEAARRFSEWLHPGETEAEFDARWDADQSFRDANAIMTAAHDARMAAMTEGERAAFVAAKEAERGIQLTPELREWALAMVRPPAANPPAANPPVSE